MQVDTCALLVLRIMVLGYHEKFPDGTFKYAVLLRDGQEVFAVSESQNDTLVNIMLDSSLKESRTTMC